MSAIDRSIDFSLWSDDLRGTIRRRLRECGGVALITIAAFMIHVYMSIWVTPGSMKGMVEGTVPSAWAKTHHRLWWQRITGRKN